MAPSQIDDISRQINGVCPVYSHVRRLLLHWWAHLEVCFFSRNWIAEANWRFTWAALRGKLHDIPDRAGKQYEKGHEHCQRSRMWHWRGLILSPSFAGSEEGEERRWEDSSLKRRVSGGVAESRECNAPNSHCPAGI
ncbi:predicted protein [Histoplasma capsulatum G186AR]|uniref:Uncharacterized protein n=1 Tax=Ajellomyces capsulatus (strain G186AR / H82 / ATCC MYA-2454 / RMSCC 2432) TaxID=447093 RepID=C0NHD7_AJECG|nr:uncharacterized protein HCBG_02759 [Histoplasma capsulatum G186AR]EEH09222.1 predicted protein [Histoplasma capsulatum G186AR]